MTGKRFSERLYCSAQEIWTKSQQHPFLVELKAGTLDPECFIYYLKQDYLYLLDYAKMYAIGSMKAEDLETKVKFAELLHSTLSVEMEYHRQYVGHFNVTREQLEQTSPSPTTISYTKYILDVATQGSLAELVAVLLPCMWSYREIGSEFVKFPGALDHPLYREWILMYSSDSFGELTHWCIGLLDRLAENLHEQELTRLEEHFVIASKLEYMFWDMAYRQEQWPI
ncbi:MAG: thiaminase II [Gorillibacterium sp.]|nr:thiaminase II [Gorillibacterium sp.]